jgi:hypothetical protein
MTNKIEDYIKQYREQSGYGITDGNMAKAFFDCAVQNSAMAKALIEAEEALRNILYTLNIPDEHIKLAEDATQILATIQRIKENG